MARSRMRFLSREEIQKIHDASIRILENIGIVVHSTAVSMMLENNGAQRSRETKRILLPENLIKSALTTVPKSIVLAGREKGMDIKIPTEDIMYVANGGEAAFVYDLITGERRYSTADDVRDFAFLVGNLPQIDFCWMMVGALDQPVQLQNLIELKTCLEFTTKHVQAMTASADEARRMIEMGAILAGGEEAFERTHLLSSVQCPVSPLGFEKGLVEAQVEFAKANVPVVSMVASVAGLTSPATLSGTIAQVNAENLASLVISQLSRDGAPWIYSTDSSAGDLRTGSIDYGAFETQISRIGAGQMARFYGIPCMVAGVWLDAASESLLSVREGVPYMILQSLVGSDLGCGFGGVDQAAGASFEQLLVDAWVWGAAREFSRPFGTDDLDSSYETISEAVRDGNYLNKRQTLSKFRKEFISVTNPEAVLTSRKASGQQRLLLRKASEEATRMRRLPKTPVVTKKESQALSLVLKKAL